MKAIKTKEKIKKYFKKVDKEILVFLLGLMLLAGLVRGYNFKEWLLVRADQVRDSEMSREVLDNGISHLRLLGPKITSVKLPGDSGKGDTLNMGPYYYYSQALSMKIFGTPSPWTIAIPDFILSLLAIPFFYLIISKFFTRKISLITTTLFSFSFLIIQYSRFSWNPNQLVFWQVLLIYFLLQFAEKKFKAGYWLLGAFLSLLVISQVHFLATSATVLIFITFFIYQKGWLKLKLKHYLIAVLMVIVFYIPVVVSDIKNDGDNYKRFIVGITQQSSEESLTDNILENIEKSARFYFYFPLPISEEELQSIQTVRFFYLVFSLGLVWMVFIGRSKFLKSINPKQKKVLAFLILLYFGFFFFVNISVADRLEKPRYWLSIAPIAFFILAFWLELINKINKRYWSVVLMVGVVGF
ncbi:MAG: glycosyltransferase family 39 protein, partial [Candidatus Moranbacteria bacterium]|nr:glycosyltransferase family 39 protein [Candidatus Moranbacteria bacterium]